MEINAKSISVGSLFKLYVKSFGYGLVIFSLLMGILAFLGFETVTWNEEPLTGFAGLIASVPIGLFIALVFTIFLWVVGILGLWINSLVGSVSITFKGITDD
jgi:hypothetical protein